MPGKFINTFYKDTMEAVTSIHEELLQNPFYLFNDKKGFEVEYYNTNTEKSTLDKGSGLAYTDIGEDSPTRFNVIHGLFLYQLTRAELNMDNGEFGLEADEISGESYILPNTIIPYDGDYFEIKHVKDSTWLFRVTSAQRDTLENGNNVYKINWVLDRTTNKDILKNIVDEFVYLDIREGSNIKAIVENTKYKKALRLDNLGSTLRSYFIDLFYLETVQTFIYKWFNDANMYDPFSIEFILRNKLLDDDIDNRVYVEHKIPMNRTFDIDYARSVYHAFEEKSKEKLRDSIYQSQADFIDSPITIFSTRYEYFYAMNYKVYSNEVNEFNAKRIIPVLEEELINHILDNEKYEEGHEWYKNIFVKYFNDEDLCVEDIHSIECIDYEMSKDMYYHLLLLIYCIDFYTKSLLS